MAGSLAEACLADVFDTCQHSIVPHKRGWQRCRELQIADAEGFADEFIAHVDRVLVIWKREPAFDRLCTFIVGFASRPEQQAEGEDEGAPLFMRLLHHLLEVADAKDKAVRFRATDLIARMMNELDEETEIDEELWEQLSSQMLKRGQDKFPIIRAAAVLALARLQLVDEEDDPVTSQYLRLLATDSCKDVRLAVLKSVRLSALTLPHVIKRTKDVSEEVRVLAYQRLGKVPMKVLKIEQRMNLIRDGLSSRDEMVKQACEDMVCGWYTAHYKDLQDGDGIIHFLSALDVEESEEVVSLSLRCLIDKGHMDQDIQRDKEAEIQQKSKSRFQQDYGEEEDADNDDHNLEGRPATQDTERWYSLARLDSDLSCERVFCWRFFCKYLQSEKLFNRLDELMPEIAKFCRLIEKNIENEFVACQLLQLGFSFDFSDEAGRRAMSALLRLHLKECGSMVVIESVMKLLRFIHTSEDEYVRLILEILSDIRDPLDDLESAEVKEAQAESIKRYEQIQDLLENIERDLKKAKTKSERDKLKEERNLLETESRAIEEDQASLKQLEDVVLERSLVVTKALLQNSTKDLRDGGIMGLLPALIEPSLQHEEASTRRIGLECLGLYCLLREETAKNYLPLLNQVIRVDEESVKEAAFQAIFDFFLAFRWTEASFNAERKSDTSACDKTAEQEDLALPSITTYNNAMDSLTELLQSEDEQLRTLAVEGWAKLLLHDVIKSEEALSQILVLSFDPTTEEDIKLRQCLATFFPLYAFSSHKHQQVVASSFLPTLRLFLRAPADSPLRSVDLSTVAQFLFFLTDESNLPADKRIVSDDITDCAHATLARGILDDILCNPSGIEGKSLPKLLNHLKLASVDRGESKRKRTTQRLLITQRTVKTLRLLTDDALEAVTDRNAKRSLTKFNSTLAQLEEEPDEQLDDEEVELIRQQSSEKRDTYEQKEPVSRKGAARATFTRTMQRKPAGNAKQKGHKAEEELSASDPSEKEDEEEIDYDALDAQDDSSSTGSDDDKEDEEEEIRPPARPAGRQQRKTTKPRRQIDEETSGDDDESQSEDGRAESNGRKPQTCPQRSRVKRAQASKRQEDSDESSSEDSSSSDDAESVSERTTTLEHKRLGAGSSSESSDEGEVEAEPLKPAAKQDPAPTARPAPKQSAGAKPTAGGRPAAVARGASTAGARPRVSAEPSTESRSTAEKQKLSRLEQERRAKVEADRKRKEEAAKKNEELARKKEEMHRRKQELERQKAKREMELAKQKEEAKRKELERKRALEEEAAMKRKKALEEKEKQAAATKRQEPSSRKLPDKPTTQSDDSSDTTDSDEEPDFRNSKQKLFAKLHKEMDHMLQSDDDSSDPMATSSDEEEEEEEQQMKPVAAKCSQPRTAAEVMAQTDKAVSKRAPSAAVSRPTTASRNSSIKPSSAGPSSSTAQTARGTRPPSVSSSTTQQKARAAAPVAPGGRPSVAASVPRTSTKPTSAAAARAPSTAKENVAPRAASSAATARKGSSDEATAATKRPTTTPASSSRPSTCSSGGTFKMPAVQPKRTPAPSAAPAAAPPRRPVGK